MAERRVAQRAERAERSIAQQQALAAHARIRQALFRLL